MRPADWDVEGALDEVISAIDAGAFGYDLDEGTEIGLRDGYRGDFQAQKAAGIEWEEQREKVLPLALAVGGLAAYLTTVKAASTTGVLPADLDQKLTYTAAWTIARSSPDCLKVEFFGGFCRNFPTPDGLVEGDIGALARAAASLGPLVALTGLAG